MFLIHHDKKKKTSENKQMNTILRTLFHLHSIILMKVEFVLNTVTDQAIMVEVSALTRLFHQHAVKN